MGTIYHPHGTSVITVLLCLIVLLSCCWSVAGQDSNPSSKPRMILVQGAGGSKEYDKVFTESCQKIEAAAKIAKVEFVWLGKNRDNANDADASGNATTDRDSLKQELEKNKSGPEPLWIILVGHGTFDRQSAKFNLRGPDLSAADLKEWLKSIERPIAIINCSSSSAPFINSLSGSGRVIVTATKSGFELNYARFGIHFADALTNMDADLDKDEQVSLLEAFLYASRRVEEFYEAESRLATEHALIDDNGDSLGTPLNFFRGFRVVKKSSDESLPDGSLANQIHLIQSEFEKSISAEDRSKRNQLEMQLEKLRQRKSTLPEDEYLTELEGLLFDLAKLYQKIESKSPAEKPKTEDGKNEEGKSTKKQDSPAGKK